VWTVFPLREQLAPPFYYVGKGEGKVQTVVFILAAAVLNTNDHGALVSLLDSTGRYR
jgi:hypothetical protein